MKLKYILGILGLMFVSCKQEEKNEGKFMPSNPQFEYKGRVAAHDNGDRALVGSASSVAFAVKGDSVTVCLKSEYKPRNYVVVTIDGKYHKRHTIKGDSVNKMVLKLDGNESHHIEIFKATEAASGEVIFKGIETEELLPVEDNKALSIEFIGDSITCGALADNSGIPCNEGEYIDQHNAYLAYGPRVARALEANFVLSSVSGIGMYRNWNDENIEEPIMPQVYENLYLNADSSKPYDFSFQPDLVSICLGTNDMSNGDGVKDRLPFNADKFTENYINFVKLIYGHYPNTKIALLNSPMIQGENNEVLVNCLEKVQAYFKETMQKEIAVFQFDTLYVNGCNYHPSVEENEIMAKQLLPFYQEILNKN
ncbi:SGNH/GDSL hydrolase family protein [Mangrovimonas sp. TPBH4]|uniref:SGNH/GDSL hydrolase family protein n=1 Tax=Mangrovimonas sp. TPBH4 TaxID=1645914 RepID=UPI0006B5C38C|nr:SGNH/GDSL hydrolase family protein [Mangrovimonas sp. TPBH4]